MEINAVLFDLDNTLVDRAASLQRFGRYLIENFGVDFACISSEAVDDIIITADGGGYRPKADFFTDLTEQIPWDNIPSVAKMTSLYAEVFPQCTVPMPGLFETLKNLRKDNYLIGLITNGSTAMQTGKIEHLSLQIHVDHITISESAGLRKPDPNIFIQTLEAMNVVGETAWFVGDHPVNDVVGAGRAKMTTVWFQRGEAWPSAHPDPDYSITHLEQLIPLLRRTRRSG